MTGAPVDCDGLVVVFALQEAEVVALRGVDLSIRGGETVALLGPSGAGKSTLLAVLAGLQRPTAGAARVRGRDLARLSARELGALRATEVGVVLQQPGRNLLGHASARVNLLFAQSAVDRSRRDRRARAAALLDAVGLGSAADRPARLLSGGEQQRLALAVALAGGPGLLLADEPTSQLDPAAAAAVVALLRDAATQHGTTVVAVTHDPTVGAALGRTVTIRDGRVGSEGRAGRDHLVVGREGSLQLSDDVLEVLPPGSLVRAVRTPDGVLLQPVTPP